MTPSKELNPPKPALPQEAENPAWRTGFSTSFSFYLSSVTLMALKYYMNHLRYIPYALYSFFVFKNPFTFLKIQAGKSNQKDCIKTWSGLSLPVWGREDTSSLSVIFLKGEYGKTKLKQVVFDVGANKGYFSMMAGEAGSKVYSL